MRCNDVGQLALEVDLSSLGAPMANGHSPSAKQAPVKAAPAQKRGAAEGLTGRSKGPLATAGKGGSKSARDPAAEMRDRQLQQESMVCFLCGPF